MLKRFALFVGSAMLIMLLVAACGGGDDEGSGTNNGSGISMDMTDNKFTPATFTAKANEKVTVNLKNSGNVVHDFTIADVGGKRVHVVVDPGKSGKAEFTPTAAGTLNFICSQPGHEAAGMKGTITVQ